MITNLSIYHKSIFSTYLLLNSFRTCDNFARSKVNAITIHRKIQRSMVMASINLALERGRRDLKRPSRAGERQETKDPPLNCGRSFRSFCPLFLRHPRPVALFLPPTVSPSTGRGIKLRLPKINSATFNCFSRGPETTRDGGSTAVSSLVKDEKRSGKMADLTMLDGRFLASAGYKMPGYTMRRREND